MFPLVVVKYSRDEQGSLRYWKDFVMEFTFVMVTNCFKLGSS